MWLTKNGYEIHQLLKGRSNCFLVIKDDKALLIDTGRKSKRKILSERLETYNKQIVGLILTHSHFDHVENAAYLKEKYQLPVFVQLEEAEFLRKGENPPVRGSFFLARGLTRLWETKIKGYFRYEPVEANVFVGEHLNLNDYGFNAYLLHTPGHSSGSMSLILDNEIAVVGDAMFGVIKKMIYPPFANDPEEMIKSWGKLLDTGCRIFLPAHGTQNSRELIESQFVKYKGKY